MRLFRRLAHGADNVVLNAQTRDREAIWQVFRRQWARKNGPVDVKDRPACPADRMIVILRRAIDPKTIASIGHPSTQALANKGVERLVDR